MPPEYIGLLVILAAITWLVFKYSKKLRVSDNLRTEVMDYAEAVVVAGILALIIIQFVARIFFIPSESMLPTLRIHDFIIVNKAVYRLGEPKRGEIVIFNPPPEANAGNKEFIKRLMGLSGETIAVENGKVLINGRPLTEPYIKEKIYYNMAPKKIPEGFLFVMGDNRNNSDDSHIWGLLPRKDLIGRAELIFFPFNRIRIFKTPAYPGFERSLPGGPIPVTPSGEKAAPSNGTGQTPVAAPTM
ncbi:MAG: signal peptidase I [Chloroflexi bacterium]|nr:signal peptidase I [Chloroflexota bacterium]